MDNTGKIMTKILKTKALFLDGEEPVPPDDLPEPVRPLHC